MTKVDGPTRAYCLIEIKDAGANDAREAITNIGGVKSCDVTTGPYDIIVVVEGETLDEIGELVTDKIHPIPSISRTVTCLPI